jgi:hypothetical protein
VSVRIFNNSLKSIEKLPQIVLLKRLGQQIKNNTYQTPIAVEGTDNDSVRIEVCGIGLVDGRNGHADCPI